MSVNKAILIGRLGKDPEVRYLDNDKIVAKFSVATDEGYTDKNGKKIEITEWHNIEIWDAMARTAEKYLKKGMLVYVEGRMRTDSYKDKDGNQRYSNKIRCNYMSILSSGNKEQSSEKETDNDNPFGTDENDLPF